MAIGNNGGSAATRFRPRGTAPVGGLGRRSLLAAEEGDQEQNEDNVEEENVSNAQQTAPEPNPAPRRTALGSRRASPTAPAADSMTQPEVLTGSLESQAEANTDVSETESGDSSTSTDPNNSPTTQTSTRARGRPRRSTRAAATLSSAPDSTVAISVSDARARMREIEQQVKQLRGDHAAELEAVNNRYRDHVSPLQAEYQELSQTITMITFGF